MTKFLLGTPKNSMECVQSTLSRRYFFMSARDVLLNLFNGRPIIGGVFASYLYKSGLLLFQLIYVCFPIGNSSAETFNYILK